MATNDTTQYIVTGKQLNDIGSAIISKGGVVDGETNTRPLTVDEMPEAIENITTTIETVTPFVTDSGFSIFGSEISTTLNLQAKESYPGYAYLVPWSNEMYKTTISHTISTVDINISSLSPGDSYNAGQIPAGSVGVLINQDNGVTLGYTGYGYPIEVLSASDASKIVKGNSILGIKGTYTPPDTKYYIESSDGYEGTEPTLILATALRVSSIIGIRDGHNSHYSMIVLGTETTGASPGNYALSYTPLGSGVYATSTVYKVDKVIRQLDDGSHECGYWGTMHVSTNCSGSH